MNFDTAIRFIIEHEGGYVFDPDDPGGETNFGISKRAYPNINIKKLTKEQAEKIYLIDYWRPGAQNKEEWIRLVYFDTSVNCGLGAAAKMYKESDSFEGFLWLRVRHYMALIQKKPSMEKFLYGWLRRVYDLEQYELKWG